MEYAENLTAEDNIMRIAIIGQQDFGKAVLEAFLARGDEVAAVFCAPEKEGARPDALRAPPPQIRHHPRSPRRLRRGNCPPADRSTSPCPPT